MEASESDNGGDSSSDGDDDSEDDSDSDSDSGGGSSGDVDVDEARELLSELTVDEWDTTSGYSRDRFSHWRTIDGCDARQTVLARDGEEIETRDEDCRVVSGVWHSPFDDVTLDDPSDIDIDHMVPLANAWRTGAADWDDDDRADFANDLDTPQLIAVSASSNRAKGDQDPSQWQPVRGFHCQYAYDWIVVKHHWELWVTEEEHDALSDMLDTCD
ncbi:DUF1524 domain-containing protein [Natronosporangium hydrolyticum]|uniref:DUF1524 domain-containing protein n=1 Tax=Natronosporangium hydrolyticum TaxID=2811111 RepID=A0A895YM40_9ACTN|nr:DUF1524 domain-containing protein [Natronosporangium hydrolyticum]